MRIQNLGHLKLKRTLDLLQKGKEDGCWRNYWTMTPFQNLECMQLVTSHIRNLRNREVNTCLAKVICLHT